MTSAPDSERAAGANRRRRGGTSARAALALFGALLAACGDGATPSVRATPTPSPVPATRTATLVPSATPTVTAAATVTRPPATATPSVEPATATATLPPPTTTATASVTVTQPPATATSSVEPATATVTPPPPTTTATASVTVTATEPIPTPEPLAIHADAEWIRDAQGRVVLLRGANYSGLEFGNFIGQPHGPEDSDFAQMETWGFNVIRLPIAWSYLEPAPNQFDETYLTEQVDRVVDFAARHGIAVIPEMHQFQWGQCFTNGNGAPAWACEGRGYGDDVFGVIRASCDFLDGATAPDGRELKDHFADVWRLVGRHYAGDRRVAGFDFFNEPHTVACPSGTAQENMLLYELYRRLRTTVQAEGADQTFFLCPPVSRNIGFPIFTEPFGPNVVYAPHLYTQTGGAPEIKYDGNASTITADYEMAAREAAEFGGTLWAGEFGGNTTVEGGFRAATELFLRDSLAEQDRRLLGGAVWAYFPSDNTFSVVDAAGNEKGELVDILARPFARRIAGIPTEMRFDPDTKEFVFAFRDDPDRAIPEPTEIFVPVRHYPAGFAIVSAGIADTSYSSDSQVLLVRRDPGASEYRVRITAP